MKLKDLNKMFDEAREAGAMFIAVAIAPMYEVIINERSQFDAKQKYYNDNYDENLQLKHAPHIQIVDCVYGRTYHNIQVKLHLNQFKSKGAVYEKKD